MFSQALVTGRDPLQGFEQKTQAILRFAQAASYKDSVTRVCSAAKNCLVAPSFAYHGYIDKDFVATSRIAAGEGAPQHSRGGTQPVQELLQPAICPGVGKSQAKEIAARLAAHGGNVTDSTSQAFVPDCFGRMPVDQKVRSLEKPVASQYRLVAGPRTPQCRIVAHPDGQRDLACARRNGLGAFIDTIEDRSLAELSGIFHYFRFVSLPSV